MKKTIALISALAVGAGSLSAQDYSISTTFGWESKYIFRGQQKAEEIFAPSVDISLGGAYFGVWAALPVDHSYGNEVDLYAGYSFPAGELLSIDLGATYYTYPDAEDDFFDSDPNSLEIYAGLAADVIASPALYVYYDFEFDNVTIEGSVGHSIPIGESSSIDFGGYIGWVNGDFDWNDLVNDDDVNDYFYYGVSADYVYSFNENVAAKIGVRYGGSDEEQILEPDDYDFLNGLVNGDKAAFWWGFSITAGF